MFFPILREEPFESQAHVQIRIDCVVLLYSTVNYTLNPISNSCANTQKKVNTVVTSVSYCEVATGDCEVGCAFFNRKLTLILNKSLYTREYFVE